MRVLAKKIEYNKKKQKFNTSYHTKDKVGFVSLALFRMKDTMSSSFSGDYWYLDSEEQEIVAESPLFNMKDLDTAPVKEVNLYFAGMGWVLDLVTDKITIMNCEIDI